MEQRPAPPVSVTAAPDVLVSGPEPRRRSPLRLAAGLAAVGLVAAALVDARSRDGGTAAAPDLTVLPGSTVRSSVTADVALLRLTLRVRNDGAAPVRVLSGGIGGYGVVRETDLPPGGATDVALERSVRCAADEPPDAVASDTLRLTVASARGPRTVELPLPLLLRDAEAQRACGFLPLDDAVAVRVLGAGRQARVLELGLELRNRSVRPTQLTGVQVGPGLRAELQDSEGALALPRTLPTAQGPRPGVLYGSLHLRVDDCDRARTAGDGSPPEVALRLRDERGRTSDLVFSYGSALLFSLLSDVC